MGYVRRGSGSGTRRVGLAMLVAGTVGVASLAAVEDAHACGGLFCNSRPPDPFAPLPVAQNGENVVFAITKDPAGGAPTLTAHIQINYTGDVAKFSWVVPVEGVPTLSTGTDRLFSQLAALTQPTFAADYQVSGTCIPQAQNTTGAGNSPAGGFATGSAGTTGAAGNTGGPGVTVDFQGAVGPFDAAVISSTDSATLKKWLTDNGYVISDAAAALIDTYVREMKHFVALKLLNGVGVKSIQPIVLTFRGVEPCVPLRLTAIAANPDMPVLVWVLSDKRVVPRGFYEMKIDEARIDWWNRGANYFGPQGLVSQAANEAGGNAFVTEYAGPSAIARGSVYANGQIDLTALSSAMTPPTYVQQLISMGLANDTLMLPLLAKYIPMPAAVKAMGVTDNAFYGNLGFYWSQYAFPAYDLAGLTKDISASIVTPRMNAQMMIDGQPYLTRLNTFLSPEEMNQDAFFFESQDLPDQSYLHTAVIRTMCGTQDYLYCNAPVRLELTDGRMTWLRAGVKSSTCQGGSYDTTQIATLPAAEVVWQREATGEGMRVMDNSATIATGIAKNNARYPAEQMKDPIVTTTGSAGAGGGGGSSGAAGMGGKGGAVGQQPGHTGGSGCRIANGGSSRWISAGLMGAMALLLARRRRQGR